ncbi:MAG TPA: hypothetical protein PKI93_04850, partial [Alphaproteobacteria bacterium]|nr:hypothetical protein [Alphaproteobacteria bacterium]
LQTASANTPRFDHDPVTHLAKGILIEESRTNYQKNSNFLGIGGGTYTANQNFSNWSLQYPAGLTGQSTTITPGASNGIPFLDIRMQATNSGASTAYITFAPLTADSMTVVSGDKTIASAWFGVTSYSSVGGACGVYVQNRSMTAGGAFLPASPVVSLSGVSAYQRRVTSSTTHAATAGTAALWSFISMPAGATCDITYRIGSPQIEKGATFETSYIPTGVNVTATRQADALSIPTGAWYNSSSGSLMASSDVIPYDASLSGAISIAFFNDGTGNNQWGLRYDTGGTLTASPFWNGGVNQTTLYTPPVLSATNSTVHALSLGTRSTVANGGAVQSGTYSASPTITNLDIGRNLSTAYLNGWIKKLKYYPARVSDTQLQLLTQ